MNPNADYEFWVIMTYQCRFLNGNKCITLVEDLIMEEAMHMWGQEVLWEISAPSTQFYCELKTTLKIKFILKKLKSDLMK